MFHSCTSFDGRSHIFGIVFNQNETTEDVQHGSFNPLTPNDHYSGRTALLTSKRCILYIYSTIIGTEYFKHGIYSSFFSLQNAVCFIILTYLVPVLFTFYIHHHMSVMELGHLLARSGLTYLEVSSEVCHDSFCLLGNRYIQNVLKLKKK